MNEDVTNTKLGVSRPDDDRTEISFGTEGMAGSTALRADCGVVMHVDNWDSARLVRLTVSHDDHGRWSNESREFIHFLTDIDARDSFEFLKKASDTSVTLPQSVSSLAVTKNQYRWLSPIYGLNALQIRSAHADLFDIGEQLIDHGTRALHKMVRSTGFPFLHKLAASVQSYRDGDTRVTRTDFLNSILVPETTQNPEFDFIPPYPPPVVRRPLLRDSDIEILEYDIDHDLVDRAWWAPDATGDGISINAMSQFSDVDVFAEIHDKGPLGLRVERIRLAETWQSDDGSFRFIGHTTRKDDHETRISIHASAVGEGSTRASRISELARRTMASVAARIHAVGPYFSMDTLLTSDPSLRADVEMASSLWAWMTGDSTRAAQCTAILSARSTSNVEGLRFVTTFPTVVGSIRAVALWDERRPAIPEIDDSSGWMLIQALDQVGKMEDIETLKRLKSPLSFSALRMDTYSEEHEVAHLSLWTEPSRDRRWELLARRSTVAPSALGLRWLRFMTALNSLGRNDPADNASGQGLVGSKSTTGMRSRTVPSATPPNAELMWRLRVAQAGL